MKPVKGVFVYKCKLSIALIYSAGMFLNKLKTKFNSFQQNGFKYKKNPKLLLTKFPHNGYKKAFKSCSHLHFSE